MSSHEVAGEVLACRILHMALQLAIHSRDLPLFLQVARNQIWREHCKKEASCLKLSGNFSVPNPNKSKRVILSKSHFTKQLRDTNGCLFPWLHMHVGCLGLCAVQAVTAVKRAYVSPPIMTK